MEFLTSSFLIVSMVFMFLFMFIGIWIFIVALKAFHQLRYRNYILEKIYQKLSGVSDGISKINKKHNYNCFTSEEDIFEMNEDSKTIDSLKGFSKHEKLK